MEKLERNGFDFEQKTLAPRSEEVIRREGGDTDGEAVSLADLERQLKRSRQKPGKRTLVIKADKRLDYGFVVRIMGISFSAGIRDISVAVKQ